MAFVFKAIESEEEYLKRLEEKDYIEKFLDLMEKRLEELSQREGALGSVSKKLLESLRLSRELVGMTIRNLAKEFSSAFYKIIGSKKEPTEEDIKTFSHIFKQLLKTNMAVIVEMLTKHLPDPMKGLGSLIATVILFEILYQLAIPFSYHQRKFMRDLIDILRERFSKALKPVIKKRKEEKKTA